jgi:short subunit dehydrogenase-like uncharacterized protein
MAFSASEQKQYNVVVWGATGFTGKIVAEYFNKNYPQNENQSLTWALAGRSEKKLRSTMEELKISSPYLVADSFDASSLKNMTSKAEVIISTVGPYSKYGTLLVEQCAQSGTHYVDLTGESPWVKEMIDKYHSIAVETGSKIIHSCGFDSIPADLGVFMLSDYLKVTHRTKPVEITYYPEKFGKSSVSGGTVASGIAIAEYCWKKGISVWRIMSDPYLLVPDGCRPDYPNPRNGGGFGYDSNIPGWTAPFIFAAHDTKVVHRSNAILSYGRLKYREVIPYKGRIFGLLPALLSSVMVCITMLLVYIPLTREVLKAFLPKPGEGPSREIRESSYFWVNLIGKGENGVIVHGRVGSDKGDAGYQETSKMLAESAITLALEKESLPKEGGILTPASALGELFIERLREKGMTFTVDTVYSADLHKLKKL